MPGRHVSPRRRNVIWRMVNHGIGADTINVFLRYQFVKVQTAQLTRFEVESTQMQAQMAASKAKLNQLTATTRSLTEGLTTLRTS